MRITGTFGNHPYFTTKKHDQWAVGRSQALSRADQVPTPRKDPKRLTGRVLYPVVVSNPYVQKG